MNDASVARTAWHSFLDTYEPLRSDLYRYCRYLTRSPWDAEDLAQDALARAFVTLAQMGDEPPNPRAWLFRVASNLWIDHVRRVRTVEPEEVRETSDSRDTREAAGTLLGSLAPKERAAVVLKDVFDLSLEEIATTLGTTVGAVKRSLHRGRTKLEDPKTLDPSPAPSPVLDAFCDAFNAHDLDRLTALLLDTSVVEVVGATTQFGPEAARRTVLFGMLFGHERLANAERLGGIEPGFVQRARNARPRVEVRAHRGRPIVLHWYQHDDGEFVRALTTIDTDDDKVARLRNFFFNPDLLAEVCTELSVPYRINGHRWWLTGC